MDTHAETKTKKGSNRCPSSTFFFLGLIWKDQFPDRSWWQLFWAPWGRTRAKPPIFNAWQRTASSLTQWWHICAKHSSNVTTKVEQVYRYYSVKKVKFPLCKQMLSVKCNLFHLNVWLRIKLPKCIFFWDHACRRQITYFSFSIHDLIKATLKKFGTMHLLLLANQSCAEQEPGWWGWKHAAGKRWSRSRHEKEGAAFLGWAGGACHMENVPICCAERGACRTRESQSAPKTASPKSKIKLKSLNVLDKKTM